MSNNARASQPAANALLVRSISRRQVIGWETTNRRRRYPLTKAGLLLAARAADEASRELARIFGPGAYWEVMVGMNNGLQLIAALDDGGRIVVRLPRSHDISIREQRNPIPYPGCYPHPSAWKSKDVRLSLLRLPAGTVDGIHPEGMVDIIQSGICFGTGEPPVPIMMCNQHFEVLQAKWGQFLFTEDLGTVDLSLYEDWFTLLYSDSANRFGPLASCAHQEILSIAGRVQGVELLNHQRFDSEGDGDLALGLFCRKADIGRILHELEGNYDVWWNAVPDEQKREGDGEGE